MTGCCIESSKTKFFVYFLTFRYLSVENFDDDDCTTIKVKEYYTKIGNFFSLRHESGWLGFYAQAGELNCNTCARITKLRTFKAHPPAEKI